MKTRPLELEKALARKYPGVWRLYAHTLSHRGSLLPDWPPWCYCPLAAAYAVVSGGYNRHMDIETANDIGRIGAMAAWRHTRGIYRIDPTLLAELQTTPIAKIPSQVLRDLPDWCVYIELDHASVDGRHLAGYYAWLEYDANDASVELRILLDVTDPDDTAQEIVHLGDGTTTMLEDGLAQTSDEAATILVKRGITSGPLMDIVLDSRTRSGLRDRASAFAGMLNILLYLCTDLADIKEAGTGHIHPVRPVRPQLKHTSCGPKIDKTPGIQRWNVGMNIGRRLRKAVDEEGCITPHGSRPHWHTYLTGPAGTVPVLRWLHPLVAARWTLPD